MSSLLSRDSSNSDEGTSILVAPLFRLSDVGSPAHRAIDAVALYVEEQTHASSHLDSSETTERIKNAAIRLLDTRDARLPISKLIWVLGRIDDPTLTDHLQQWLAHYAEQAARYNAAIHNTVVILDLRTGKQRSASVTDVAENIRRADDYANNPIGGNVKHYRVLSDALESNNCARLQTHSSI